MKKVLPFLLILLFGMTFLSQAQDCYQSTRSQGISLYNRGECKEAKKIFEAAKKCPDKPEKDDLDAWVAKCEKSAPVFVDKFSIESITFSGGSQEGRSVTSCYTDEFLALVPKVVVNYTGKSKKKARVSITVTDPYGDKLDLGGSDKYSETIDRTFNKGKTDLEFSSIQRFTDQPTDGTYYFEVLINDKLVKTTSFEVLERPTTLAVNNNTHDFDVVLGYNSGIQMFTIRTNNRFEIKHKPTWVNIEGINEDTFTISYLENNSKEVREGLMDICTSNGKKKIVVTLKQEGKPEVVADTKPISKIGLRFYLPDFVSSASNELGSVIDYGVTDVPTLAHLEEPNYRSAGGFGFHYGIDIPLNYNVFFETGVSFAHMSIKNTFDNDDLLYTLSNGEQYSLVYGCKEKYNLNYIQIPALIGYELELGRTNALHFTAGVLAGVGISAKCKLEEGYSNWTMGEYYGNSTFSGSANLFSGDYTITQHYSTGQQPTFEYKDEVAAPFKRFDLGINIGASFLLDKFEIGMAYYFGIMNIGRNDYFNSTNRIGGCPFAGEFIRTEQGMKDYKHKINNLQFFINYCL